MVTAVYEFKYPFEPPWNDLRLTVTSSAGAMCYLFDSCVCKGKEREELDRLNGELLARFARERALRTLAGEVTEG